MKRIIFSLITVTAILFTGCQKDLPEVKDTEKQDVTFNIGQSLKGLKNDYMDCSLEADYALIVLNDDYDNPIMLPVFYVDEVMYTQAIKLSPGSYTLNEFMLYQEAGLPESTHDDVLLSATPHTGGDYAQYVDNPLSFDFTVEAFTKKEIPVSILCYEPKEYEAFGFTWFRVDTKDLEEGLFFGDFCTDEFMAYTGSIYGDYPKVDMPAIFQIVLRYDADGDGTFETTVGTYNNEDGYVNGEWTASVPPLSIKYVDHPDQDDFYRMDVYIYELIETVPVTEERIFGYMYFETWYFVNDIDIMTKGVGDTPEDNVPGTETVGPGSDGVYDFIVGPCTVIEWDIDVNEPNQGDDITTETAFAKAEEGSECFIEHNWSRWGWTNLITNTVGATYELNIYAGAGQCDITKGYHAGVLTVEITAADQAVVTYTVFEGVELREAHLYVGEDMFPKKNNGNFTIAPGQYPYKDDSLGGVSTVSFTVDIPSGQDFWLIAHSVVGPAE